MFSPTYFSWGVGHSWENYIYSSPMLYNDSKPCEIFEFISALSISGLSPILPDNYSNDSSIRTAFCLIGMYNIISKYTANAVTTYTIPNPVVHITVPIHLFAIQFLTISS